MNYPNFPRPLIVVVSLLKNNAVKYDLTKYIVLHIKIFTCLISMLLKTNWPEINF